ncbi:MAG: hypothetical protein H6743_03805 [Rickettsiaceae bacterium]|nr:hypothetical protein [Rickettsiaceae bacterium]
MCKEEKSLEEFHKSPRNKSGYISHCKTCMTKYAKKRWQKEKEDKKKLPSWACPRCGHRQQLDFDPLKDYQKLLSIKCEKCN